VDYPNLAGKARKQLPVLSCQFSVLSGFDFGVLRAVLLPARLISRIQFLESVYASKSGLDVYG